MDNRTLIATVLVIQGLLVLVDLGEHILGTSSRPRSEPLRRRTVGLLVVVTMAFLLVQIGGLKLLPGADRVFAWAQQTFARLVTVPPTDVPLQGQRYWLLAVVTFYLAGLSDYAVHRAVSHSRWFWFTHEYHHLPNQVSVIMPGILVRPYVAFATLLTTATTSLCLYAVFVICGLPLWDLQPLFPVLAAIAIVQTASHSMFLRRFWWVHQTMRLIGMTTPQEHLLHHTWEMGRNYGNFTTIWDRLFLTYAAPHRWELPQPLGLPYDQDFLGTLTLGLVKLPRSLRARFQLSRFCNLDVRGKSPQWFPPWRTQSE